MSAFVFWGERSLLFSFPLFLRGVWSRRGFFKVLFVRCRPLRELKSFAGSLGGGGVWVERSCSRPLSASWHGECVMHSMEGSRTFPPQAFQYGYGIAVGSAKQRSYLEPGLAHNAAYLHYADQFAKEKALGGGDRGPRASTGPALDLCSGRRCQEIVRRHDSP